jgi:hypothetical protein
LIHIGSDYGGGRIDTLDDITWLRSPSEPHNEPPLVKLFDRHNRVDAEQFGDRPPVLYRFAKPGALDEPACLDEQLIKIAIAVSWQRIHLGLDNEAVGIGKRVPGLMTCFGQCALI